MPSATADYLRSNYPHLNLQGVPVERQALQLLLSQQAAYAVVDEAQLGRLSVEPEFAGLVVVERYRPAATAAGGHAPRLAGTGRHRRKRAAGDPGQGPGATAQPMAATQVPAAHRVPGFLAKPLPVAGGVGAQRHAPSCSGSVASSTVWSNDWWRRGKTLPCVPPAKRRCGSPSFPSIRAPSASSGSTGTAMCATPTARPKPCWAIRRAGSSIGH